MSNLWFLVPFCIGSAAFFATLYVTIYIPKMSDTPWQEKDMDEVQPLEVHPLKQWDTVLTWVMWGGWGVAMFMHFLAKGKYIDQLERLFS